MNFQARLNKFRQDIAKPFFSVLLCSRLTVHTGELSGIYFRKQKLGRIFKFDKQNIKDINDALSRWPKLKVLHLYDYTSSRLNKLVSHWEKLKEFTLTTEILGINLTEHALLRKIVVPESMPLAELGDWGKATKVWFDPKNWNPAKFENVIQDLKLQVNSVPQYLEIMHNVQFLINIEELRFLQPILLK